MLLSKRLCYNSDVLVGQVVDMDLIPNWNIGFWKSKTLKLILKSNWLNCSIKWESLKLSLGVVDRQVGLTRRLIIYDVVFWHQHLTNKYLSYDNDSTHVIPTVLYLVENNIFENSLPYCLCHKIFSFLFRKQSDDEWGVDGR